MFCEQKRCGSTISISLYFYFSFIEKISILSSENWSLDNTFTRSLERSEFFDPAGQLIPDLCFYGNLNLKKMGEVALTFVKFELSS